MANIYDDEQNPKGSSTKEPLDAASLRDKENQSSESSGWWNDSSKGADDGLKGAPKRFAKTVKESWSGASWRKKFIVASAAGSVLAGLALGLVSIFNFMNIFQLDHLMSNIERKGFIRYQVVMEGRSNKWIAAYLALRLAEVEDPSLKPANRDNIIFRANKVQNNLFTDWYRTMRTSKFEQDLLEKSGIKFGSIACRGTIVGNECRPGGNMVRFRPIIISINDDEVRFTPTAAEIKAIENGDINGFNNRLRQFIQVEILESDKAGRDAVRRAVNANTKPYQVIKRYYLRKSIQNMTGIRDWRFFEKTRDKFDEKKIEIRNKIIAKSFPESTKSGKFIQCMFGISSCKTTTDPSNPANRSTLASVSQNCSTDSSSPECVTGKVDENGNPIQNDGQAEAGLTEGVSGGEDITQSLTKKMLTQVISKVGGATGVISFIDTLNTVNNNIKNGTLSAMVYMARATQAIGLFTTVGIMRDQMRSGEVNAEEVNAAMEVFDNAGSSEGWQNLVASGDVATASAAATEYVEPQNKKEYCDPIRQEQMLLPENAEKAKNTFHYLCDSEKIGGENLAKKIEDGWNSSVGIILSPILSVYEGSGLSTVVGWVNNGLDAIMQATVQPLIEGVLSAIGLKGTIEEVVGWVVAKAAAILGAGPAMAENAPPGVYANHVFMGAAASSEFAMRYAGAAATTEESAMLSRQNTLAFQQAEEASMSFGDKYLSLANANSLASRSLFAVTDQNIGKTMRSAFASIINLPATLLGGRANAATEANDPHAAARFAGVETYDFPVACMNQEPFDMIEGDNGKSITGKALITPAARTNADDLGLIPAEELTWDLLANHDNFSNRLYEDDPDPETAKKVYNCELLDVTVRGGIGGLYSDKVLGPNAYGSGFSSQSSLDTTNISGDELKTSSVNTPCAAGAPDLGTTTGYTEERPVEIRLCAIPGLPSSSQESTKGDKYYVPGSDGLAIVNSKVSANFMALVKAAKQAGLKVAATSSFRTMAHQTDLCNRDKNGCSSGNYRYVAKPGTSNHQMGLAIDFKFTTINNDKDNCVNIAGVCSAPSDPFWNWLDDNAQTYGIAQYEAEFWHWEPAALR